MGDPLLVTARLASPLAGDARQLDSLMEWLMSVHFRKGVPGYKVDRQFAAPPQAGIPIPVLRRRLGDWLVACTSSPIASASAATTVGHVCKRLAVEDAGLLHPDGRLVVATSNGTYKGYRIPLAVRGVPAVSWFAVGDRREVLKLVRRATFVSRKASIGYGRVAEWSVERADADLSWFAPSDLGPVLMRPLPAGPWLPDGLLGARTEFGACVPPYWHPDRYTETVVPC